MTNISKIKHCIDINSERIEFYFRLDMKLFGFSSEQIMKCFGILQNEVLIPLSKTCVLFCDGPQGRSVKPHNIVNEAEECYAGENGTVGVRQYGVSFNAMVKTERMRYKKDLQDVIKVIDFSRSIVGTRFYDFDTKEIILPPKVPDFEIISEAQKQGFFDEIFTFANRDKIPFGCPPHIWEVDGMLTAAEMIDCRTGKLESIGDLQIGIAFPCIAHDVAGFYTFLKDLALSIHNAVPSSYGAVGLGSYHGNSYNYIYNTDYTGNGDRLERLINTYPFVGSFNIITEAMTKRVTIAHDNAKFVSLEEGGAIIEAGGNPFTMQSLKSVRTVLEPILAEGCCEHIKNLFYIPTILPIPREDFIEIAMYGKNVPVITNIKDHRKFHNSK